MGSPVLGLRPRRALRCTFFIRPSPGSTKMPAFLVCSMASSTKGLVKLHVSAPALNA